MKKYFEILKSCALFESIDENDLLVLLDCLKAAVKDYKKNEYILSEGEWAKYIGIVLSGEVQIERTDYHGNRSIIGIVSPSELFGESFACAGVKYLPVSVLAKENSSVMLIDCQRILTGCSSACHFHNRMRYNIMGILAKKNLAFHKKLEITSKRTTREKLLSYLEMEAKSKSCPIFTIPFDRQALADYLGVDRSGLSLEIAKLRKEGVLKSTKNHFELL